MRLYKYQKPNIDRWKVKKNLQFNDDFEIFILCFTVLHGAIEHLISFLLFHISKCITEKELER
jgi:hypothetical protein